jgi:hypothetical protein
MDWKEVKSQVPEEALRPQQAYTNRCVWDEATVANVINDAEHGEENKQVHLSATYDPN